MPRWFFLGLLVLVGCAQAGVEVTSTPSAGGVVAPAFVPTPTLAPPPTGVPPTPAQGLPVIYFVDSSN